MKRPNQIHLCGWPQCRRPIPLEMWGCKTHWFSLPKEFRDAIWVGYRQGKLSAAWLAANEAALEWIDGIPDRARTSNAVTPLADQGENDVDSDAPRG